MTYKTTDRIAGIIYENDEGGYTLQDCFGYRVYKTRAGLLRRLRSEYEAAGLEFDPESIDL